MKQVLLILTALLTTYITYSQNNFELAANGVTCLCPNANVGDTGTLTINGENKTFTQIYLHGCIQTQTLTFSALIPGRKTL